MLSRSHHLDCDLVVGTLYSHVSCVVCPGDPVSDCALWPWTERHDAGRWQSQGDALRTACPHARRVSCSRALLRGRSLHSQDSIAAASQTRYVTLSWHDELGIV